MIIPPYIKPGDTIAIVSPASVIDRKHVDPAVDLLTGMGFKVLIGNNAFSSFHQFSSTDTERASDLQSMLDNENVSTIICARGGYGSLRTLQHINWEKFMQKPKWLVGFSDITVFHSALTNLGVVSIHGVMPRYFLKGSDPSFSFQTLIAALSGETLNYEMLPASNNRLGKTKGLLTGGNLSMIYSLRGTSFDIDTRGKILFIEDLGEYMYHLDRMMMNLKTGGMLSHLAGMIIGTFTEMKDKEIPYGKTIEEIIFEAVEEYDFPVAFQFPAGHGENNFSLKLGAEISMEVTETGSTITQI
jgi:muramoyltetrapeptide carboxypeptidase